MNRSIELAQGRTTVFVKASSSVGSKNDTSKQEREAAFCDSCRKHPDVPLWRKWYDDDGIGRIIILNPVCPLCEIESFRKARAERALSSSSFSTTATRRKIGTLNVLADHFANLSSATFSEDDPSSNMEVLVQEFKRITTKMDKGMLPNDAINMRRVTYAVEDAMAQLNKRFGKKQATVAFSVSGGHHRRQVYAVDQIRALYSSITQVKEILVAFQCKSEKAQAVANQVLERTLSELYGLVEQLDDQACEWGHDIKGVRDDLEYARAHIGSLQVALREANVELSTQVQTAIRSFTERSVLLEARMDNPGHLDHLEARVSSKEAEIDVLKRRIAQLERARKLERSEMDRVREQIMELRLEMPVVQATAVTVDSFPTPSNHQESSAASLSPRRVSSSIDKTHPRRQEYSSPASTKRPARRAWSSSKKTLQYADSAPSSSTSTQEGRNETAASTSTIINVSSQSEPHTTSKMTRHAQLLREDPPSAIVEPELAPTVPAGIMRPTSRHYQHDAPSHQEQGKHPKKDPVSPPTRGSPASGAFFRGSFSGLAHGRREDDDDTDTDTDPDTEGNIAGKTARSAWVTDMNGMDDSDDDVSCISGFCDVDDDHDHPDKKRSSLPERVIVQNAGLHVVDGLYVRDGTFDGGAGKYVKNGMWNGVQQVFTLFRCHVSNDTKHWYISIVPDGIQPGTNKDIDFYSAPMSSTEQDVPASEGWMKSNEGILPAPRIRVYSSEDDGWCNVDGDDSGNVRFGM